MKQIHELNERSAALALGDYLPVDNGNDTEKIDYTKLAKAIIEQYNLSALGGSNRTLKATLDALQDSVDDDLVPKSDIVNNVTTSTTGKVLDASQGKALQDQVTALNSRLVLTVGLNNTGKTILEYLDSLPNGCVVHAHAWTRISDMPASLTTGRIDVTFVTDKSERIYDYVIAHKDGAEWYAYPNSNTLGSRSLTWVQQPTRTEVNELNSNLDVKVGTFTQASGQSISNNLLIRQTGHVVSVWGYLQNVTINSEITTSIGSILNVSLPANVVRTYCNIGANAYTVGTVAYIGITSTGDIQIVSPSGGAGSGKTVYFAVSWIR